MNGYRHPKGYHPKSEFKKGHTPWNKGLTIKDDRVKKWNKKGIETRNWLYSEGKIVPWNKGKKGVQVGWCKGKKRPEMVGKKHPMWKGGRSTDKEWIKQKNRKWIEENRDRAYFLNERRRIRKLKAGGFHTFQEWQELKRKYNYTCPSCNEREPFQNQRCFLLTEDHIVPIAKWNGWIKQHPEISYECDDINNIQPLCLKCNVRKHTKIIFFKPMTYKYQTTFFCNRIPDSYRTYLSFRRCKC